MGWKYPRTEYKQRREFYSDVESLLNPGFLSHPIQVRGVNFSLRSLYPSDIYLLSNRVGLWSSDHEWKTWWVASSIWMVNGISLLEESHSPHKMYDSLRKLPKGTLNLMYTIALGLVSRVNKALDAIEAYCYEDVSRLMWRQCGRKAPLELAGIPGISSLGLNTVQRVWVAFNITEDDRLSDQSRWEHAKLIASASAPKGIEKISRRDNMLWEEEEERRKDQMDFHFYLSLGLLTEDDALQRDRHRLNMAKTVDELEEEMRKWIDGEMDEHDKIVEEYKSRILHRLDLEKQQRAIAWEQARVESAEDNEYLPPIPLTGFTADQVQSFLRNRKSGNARQIVDPSHSQQYLNNFLHTEVSAGHLEVNSDKILDTTGQSLQDQIEFRRLILGEDGEVVDG